MRSARVLAAVGLVVLALTGCTAVSDGVAQATSQVACAVVTPIAENVGRQVQVVADDIALDPSGAITTLQGLKDQVDGAAATTSGDISTRLTSVAERIGELITQAESARDGGVVSQEGVDGIEASIVESLTSLAGDC